MKLIFIDGEYTYDDDASCLIIKIFELIQNASEDFPNQPIHLEVNELITRTLFDETFHNILTLKPTNEQISEYLLADKDAIFKCPKCLQYAINNGIEVDDVMLENILTNKSSQCIQCVKVMIDNSYKLPTDSCDIAIQHNNIEFLKCAHENGCPWNAFTCNGCPWNAFTCCNAAENGHFECLKYAHENGCPWDTFTCSNAATRGHLECLKYAHENGCVWDKYVCRFAAENGHLECLKYAHENGCEWDASVCKYTARYGHLECLKYAHKNGCPYDYVKIQRHHKSCAKYIKKHM